MIKTSYHIHISYPDGGGINITPHGDKQIVKIDILGHDSYTLWRGNGSIITVPIAWTMVEIIKEDAPEDHKSDSCCEGVREDNLIPHDEDAKKITPVKQWNTTYVKEEHQSIDVGDKDNE